MRRSLKKLLSFSLAVAVMVGSMYKIPVNAADAGQVVDGKVNGDLMMVQDYKYDNYRTSGSGAAAFATNTGEKRVSDNWEIRESNNYTEDTEIYIINGEEDKEIVLSNDGAIKYEYAYSYATGSDALFIKGAGMVTEYMEIMENYSGAIYCTDGKSYLARNTVANDYTYNVYDYESLAIIKENVFTLEEPDNIGFYMYTNGYVVTALNNGLVILLSEDFEVIKTIDVNDVIGSEEFIVCINENKEIYTIDKEFNENHIVIESIYPEEYSLYKHDTSMRVSGIDEYGNYEYYELVDALTINKLYNRLVKKCKDGLLINNTEYTTQQLMEIAGIESDGVAIEDVVLEYDYRDAYIFLSITAGDIHKNITLAKKQNYSFDSALIVDKSSIRYCDEENSSVVVDVEIRLGLSIDEYYVALEDGWVCIFYSNDDGYYDVVDHKCTIYDYEDNIVKEFMLEDVAAMVNNVSQVFSYSFNDTFDYMRLGVYNEEIHATEYVYLPCSAYGDVNAIVRGEAEFENWDGYSIYVDENDDRFIWRDGAWRKIGYIEEYGKFYFTDGQGVTIFAGDWIDEVIVDAGDEVEYVGSSYFVDCYKNNAGKYILVDNGEALVLQNVELTGYTDYSFCFENTDGTYSVYIDLDNFGASPYERSIKSYKNELSYYYEDGERCRDGFYICEDEDGSYWTIYEGKFVEVMEYTSGKAIIRIGTGDYVVLDISRRNDYIIDKSKELVSLTRYSAIFKNEDGKYTLYISEGEPIKLDYYVEIEMILGNYFVLKEEQKDGSFLYGIAKLRAFTYGDATGDDKINVMDAVLMKKHIAGFEGLTINLDACDVNKDGRVNVMDAVMVLKYIAGFDVSLGE